MILSGATILLTTAATANTNGMIFPPDNALANAKNAATSHMYPPKVPAQPTLKKSPSVPAYNFNRQGYQQQNMRYPQQNTNGYRAAPMYPSFGQRPQQRAVPMRPQQARNKQYPSYPQGNRNNNGFPFSNNMMPFGNSGNNNFFPFSNNSMPFGNGNNFGMPSNPMNNMFGNNNKGNMPFFNQSNKKRKKAWGTERNIWPDFYTDFTDEAWDTVTRGPRSLGEMPGGWRFPHISTPDPVTVSDAIVNQFPPIAEEAGNMADFSDWGVFDNK